MPGDDLNMSIIINTSVSTNEDDIILSLGHSFKGVQQNLTKYLAHELSKEGGDEEDVRVWKIEMTLPYPYSQSSGDLTLSVGDNLSGDITSTRLIIGQEDDKAPYFDPVPKSVKAYPGKDVLINTRAKGSSPINVS